VKDRSDELSTADLAGQSAGSGDGSTVADERAVRAESADQTGERRDTFPGARSADLDYADDRSDYAGDRVGGAGSRGFPGRTPADDTVAADRADADPTVATDRLSYTGDTTVTHGAAVADDRAGYADDRAGYADDAAVAGDRADHADDRTAGRLAGGPAPDDRGFGGGAGDVREPAAASMGTATGNGVARAGTAGHEAGPLLAGAESEGFRARWTDVQAGFVDAPRRAVEQADGLVAELMQHLAKTFADERSRLESQWDRGEDIATDDLRTAFQRYRAFFERLLST
jgi:hypothetical protein